jgi:hypothetical protein
LYSISFFTILHYIGGPIAIEATEYTSSLHSFNKEAIRRHYMCILLQHECLKI